MKIFICLLAILTVVSAHGGHWSQGGGGAGYAAGRAYGGGQSHGGSPGGLYGGGHKAAQSPPIVSHVSRNGDSTRFSIGQQGHIKPIAPAPTGGLYGGAHHGGLYGGSHSKSQYGGSYGYGENSVPESSFDYTVKHPTSYGSNNGWDSQSGAANLGGSSHGHDTVPGTSYEHTASGAPSQLYASPVANSGWNGAGGSYKSKSPGWWSKRN